MYLAISDINRSYTHNLEDQATQAGSITYHYNDDDFLSKKVDGTETTLYDYSSMGELKSVTLPGGMVFTYTHYFLTRPIAKSIDGYIVENYIRNGRTQLLAVLKPDNSIHQRFIYADDRLPYAMTQDNQIFYMAYDQVGSLRVVTDGSGNVVKEVRYDTFGNIIEDSNPGFEIPFGFAGGLHDVDTGLVRFGYRDYAPEIGRWTAKDPIGFAGGDSNLYGYVLGDPVNWVDPEGLWTTTIRGSTSLIFADVTLGFAFDGNNNWAFIFSTSPGFSPSVGLTLGATITNADCVYELEGVGTVSGYAFKAKYGGEINFVQGDGYEGIDFGLGPGLAIPLLQGFKGPTIVFPITEKPRTKKKEEE